MVRLGLREAFKSTRSHGIWGIDGSKIGCQGQGRNDSNIHGDARKEKVKPISLLKVLKSSVITIPSMLQYLGGSCSLDLMVGIDCSVANGDYSSEKNLHYSASHWLNDYQAGIQNVGTIVENFARGKHSSMWGSRVMCSISCQ
jgi:hypothetical protein